MNLHAAAPASVDLATIKGRQQAAWASGDYAVCLLYTSPSP